jgi:HAD superfamily hydrolase (TIGR01450 family)
MEDILARHAALFLDAYGVLTDSAAALPGARALIDALTATKKPYFILTNDASRTTASLAARFLRLGLPIPEERIVSSGSLLEPYFVAEALVGKATVVLGPPDAHTLARNAGARLVPVDPAARLDVLVVCDESGFPFLETVDDVLTMLVRTIDAGGVPALVLPNPDRVYPRPAGALGFAAGTIARMFEEALAVRYPKADGPRFVRLGKPHRAIFDEACRRAKTRDAVHVGDQIETDIRGASAAGLASALVTFGLTRALDLDPSDALPTYLLPSLWEGTDRVPRG